MITTVQDYREEEIDLTNSIISRIIAKTDLVTWIATTQNGLVTISGVYDGFLITLRQVLCVNGSSHGHSTVNNRVPHKIVDIGRKDKLIRKTKVVPPYEEWNLHEFDLHIEDRMIRWNRRHIINLSRIDEDDGDIFYECRSLFNKITESGKLVYLDEAKVKHSRSECLRMFNCHMSA
jgi:hypothetical protein